MHPEQCTEARSSAATSSLGLIVVAVLLGGIAPLPGADIPLPADAPAALAPEASAAAFRVPEGFRVDVVASEPLISSPTAICWDERGRLFVGELHGYNLEGQLDIDELNKSGQLDHQVRRVEAGERFKRAARSGTYGVVKMLTSSRGDGRMDHAEIWASDLPPVYGLIPARGGVIVACTPQIVYLADSRHDGKADVREVLFSGFGVGEMWRGVNCPLLGADGWIYFGQGWPGSEITGPHLAAPVRLRQSDFRIRADGTAIEPVTGATGTFGFAFTAGGDRFVTNTTQPANLVAPLPWRDLMRNPDAICPSPEVRTGDSHAYARAKPHPWRQKRADDPAYFKFYHDAYGAAESEAGGWFTAACGPLVYRDAALPGLHGQYFVCEPALSLIHRALLTPDGSALAARRAPGEETSEFLASTDSWCHPISLVHGPEGAIWIVDFYREIIEDYSAIPRHLQQQYGVYNGHERGRIYRLTHRDLPSSPSADMSRLAVDGLAGEIASPLLWRRQTAQRLLTERHDLTATGPLRALLDDPQAAPESLVAAISTLAELDALTAAELRPLISHPDQAVRLHALRHAEGFLPGDRSLLDAVLVAAAGEHDPRVLIQFALSLGASDDARALEMLAAFAREHMAVRWMDGALLSSLHGRGLPMLGLLLSQPGGSAPLLAPLTRSIAASHDEASLGGALALIATAHVELQVSLLGALTAGRGGAAGLPDDAAPARLALAPLAASASPEVRRAARALEDTFAVAAARIVAGAGADTGTEAGAPTSDVGEETFRTYLAALGKPRDVRHGHALYLASCAMCHRIKDEGKEVGPDLLGELGADETLVRDVLMPSERIRPGYETTLVTMTSGAIVTGLLKEDGATSLTLVGPGAVEQVLLRKDVAGVRRILSSLMPPFGHILQPADVADLLAWLRSNLGAGAPGGRLTLFDEELDFAARFDEGDGSAEVVGEGAFSGTHCLHVTSLQRAARRMPGWDYRIVQKPTAPGEYRYLRLAWRARGAGVMIELAREGTWPRAEDAAGRYGAGANGTPWKAHMVTTEVPRAWTQVTLDLWKDLGACSLTGIAPTAIGGDAWFDRIELLQTP